MKNYKFYEDHEKKNLLNEILIALKAKKTVSIAVDCKITEESQLKKPSFQHSIKRAYKLRAKAIFKEAKNPKIRMILPNIDNAEINGYPLEKGIAIPAYAPETFENDELTEEHVAYGLVLMLEKERDEYYLNILKAYDLPKEGMKGSVVKILDGTYWDKPIELEKEVDEFKQGEK